MLRSNMQKKDNLVDGPGKTQNELALTRKRRSRVDAKSPVKNAKQKKVAAIEVERASKFSAKRKINFDDCSNDESGKGKDANEMMVLQDNNNSNAVSKKV